VGLTLWRNARLATLDGSAPWGLVERGAIVAGQDGLGWVGAQSELPRGLAVDAEHDLGGRLVTPGLVDCHTHLVYAGDRAREFELRLQGASYEEIARAGGGIRATVAATRAAGDEALLDSARQRALALMAEGVTTLEVKSGYGLSFEHEARLLRIARRLEAELPLTVRTTCLAAHALPPEFEGRADDYVDAVCAWLPALQAEGLVDAVDAFCDRIGFSQVQTRRVLEAARALGLPVKLHAEQLSDQGGALLAAATISSTSATMALPPWRTLERSPCCCRVRSISCGRAGCHPWTSCARRACRWPWRPITIRARRRPCRRC